MVKSTFSEKYALFRQLLIEARQKKGLTQSQVAETLNKPQSFVSKYESGERRIDLIEFLEVAQVLGVPSYEFLRKLEKQDTIFDRWDITSEELTEIVDKNPSLRGAMIGYIAEKKLHEIWFSCPQITYSTKYDDHDRKNKGDLVITYKNQSFKIECKSLQTSSVRLKKNKWTGKCQCDASDRRKVYFPDGTSVETTCLLINEFDLLAVNLFAFENEWRFVFVKNNVLPRTKHKKYTPEQQKLLLKGSVNVSWPPELPFTDEPFQLLDEIIEERANEPDTPPTLATIKSEKDQEIEIVDIS